MTVSQNGQQAQVKLFQGRSYMLRVRLYYAQSAGETGVMMW